MDRIDDQLSAAIQHIEVALKTLRLGVSVEVEYETPDGRFVLSFAKSSGQWHIMHGREAVDDGDQVLTSTSRLTRLEVFMPDAEGVTPMERLIVGIVDSLEQHALDRSPALDAAKRISQALEAAGFPAPASSRT